MFKLGFLILFNNNILQTPTELVDSLHTKNMPYYTRVVWSC